MRVKHSYIDSRSSFNHLSSGIQALDSGLSLNTNGTIDLRISHALEGIPISGVPLM